MEKLDLAKYWYFRLIDNLSKEKIEKDQKLDWQLNKLGMFLIDNLFDINNGLRIRDKVILRIQASFYYGADRSVFKNLIKELKTGDFKMIWDKNPDGLTYDEYFKNPEVRSTDNKRLITALDRLHPFDKNVFYSIVESVGRRRKKDRIDEHYFNGKLHGIHLVENKNLEIVDFIPSIERFADMYASHYLHSSLPNDRKTLEELELFLKKLEPSRVNKFEKFIFSIGIDFEKAKETEFVRSIPERYTFVRRGGTWNIVYEYSESVGVNNSMGMHYIHFLLQNNKEQFSILSLVRHLGDYDKDLKADRDKRPNVILKTEHLHNEDDEIIISTDPRGLKDLKKRLYDINKELSIARNINDLIQIEILQNEFSQISLYINSTYRSARRIRDDKSNIERQIRRVRKLINTAFKNIKKHNVELFKHLKFSIHMGQYFQYAPDRDIDWQL